TEIAVRGSARERLRPLQTDAAQVVRCEIEPANVLQDFRIAVARRKLAESAGSIVDAELEMLVGTRFNVVIDEIASVGLLVALGSLLANESAVLSRHELAARCHPISFRNCEHLPFETLQLNFADCVVRNPAPLQDPADCHESEKTHEKISHPTERAADI